MTEARTIGVRAHGRYLVERAAGVPQALVIGFHGYAEPAESQLARLKTIPGSEHFLLVSVQALNRFYRRRTQEVIASWMTRQDRELAIADNVAYVSSVVAKVSGECPATTPIVYAGFSQGASMAYRAVCLSSAHQAAVIALGGDIPPELDEAALRRIPSALLGRGLRDEWYTQAKLDGDVERLRAAGVPARTAVLDAAHEWTAEFGGDAAAFIGALPSTRRPSAARHRK
jgi:predicted esterase